MGNNVVNVAIASIVTVLVVSYPPAGIAVVAATAVTSLVVIVFGEIVPKSYGLGQGRPWAERVAPAIGFVELAFLPVVIASTRSRAASTPASAATRPSNARIWSEQPRSRPRSQAAGGTPTAFTGRPRSLSHVRARSASDRRQPGTAHVALQTIDLAEQYGATLHAINGISGPGSAAGRARRLARGARGTRPSPRRPPRRHGRGPRRPCRDDAARGRPATEILDYADEIAADATVAGTHGRTGIDRRVIGSVAERLVRHAGCPMMTVRLPETDVTVSDAGHARELIEAALAEQDLDAEIQGVTRQQQVWVGEAVADARGRSGLRRAR